MFGEAGQVLSMSYIPLVSPLAPKSCEELDPVPESAELTSKISYETPTPGMSLRAVLAAEKPPPGLKFLQFKRSPNQGGGGATGPNPILGDGSNDGEKPPAPSGPFGFLSRYWYILLPIMLMNIMMSPADPQQQQQQQQHNPAQGQDVGGGGGGASAAQQGSAVPSPRVVEASTRAPSTAAGTAAASSSASRQRRGKRG
jgi:hypothetical protein